ncbi:EF-hand calcium-binding domain-containing protein 12 isoform X2 [Octodon degus]|uniref:EF-hand calcium-binding domain-containing protein 12 isoform X2 n=1 Tax=Octodon degus TaxID=10160 RepID=A0A6P6DNW6_OCTDE|nr:EF-hand calcium-binding domain-containing protein 12 isoform X2 [Octodon degus]
MLATPRTEGCISASGSCQPETLEDDGSTDVVPAFDPEPVIAHCFKQFKQDFQLPKSRRRVIIVPAQQGQVPVNPTSQPLLSPPPVPSLRGLDAEGQSGNIPRPLEDRVAWLHQRTRLRKELDAMGDVTQWLKSKPSLSLLETKVLRMLHEKRKAQVMGQMTATTATKKKAPQRVVPQLRLPKPLALSALYTYLRRRKIQVLELFSKDQVMQQKVSREEFLSALRKVGVPLKHQEIEDVVIYLSSLGKQHNITMKTLASTYKQWFLAQQRSTLSTVYKGYIPAQSSTSPQPCKKDLLTVPEVPIPSEARPLTLEEMEDVGKHYRERRRQLKLPIPSIQYTESCRLVSSGDQRVDHHCLPSTVAGEHQELLDTVRRDDFLLYLRCRRQCMASGVPVTEDVLSRALLYPGDRIILQDTQVLPIRQPGGFYCDLKALPTHTMQGPRLGPQKSDKLSVPMPLPTHQHLFCSGWDAGHDDLCQLAALTGHLGWWPQSLPLWRHVLLTSATHSCLAEPSPGPQSQLWVFVGTVLLALPPCAGQLTFLKVGSATRPVPEAQRD